jgi:hypothetical protein
MDPCCLFLYTNGSTSINHCRKDKVDRFGTDDSLYCLHFPLLLISCKVVYHRSYFLKLLQNSGPDSSVGIATDYALDGPGSNPGGDEIFRPSRPALGPTQPPVQWVPGLSRGAKCSGGVLLTTHPLLVSLSW